MLDPATLDAGLRVAVTVMVIAALLTMGLGLAFEQVLASARRGGTLALAFALDVIAVPLIAVGLCRALAVPPAAALGIVLCAAAPGGGIGVLFVHLARGDVALAVTLLFLFTAASTVITPIAAMVLGAWVAPALVGSAGAGGDGAGVLAAAWAIVREAWPLVRVSMAVQLLPLVVGIALRSQRPGWADVLAQVSSRTSTGLLVVVTLGYLWTRGAELLANGVGALVATFATCLLGLGLAWLAGAWLPSTRAQPSRIALALMASNRSMALGLLIANAAFPDPATVLAVLGYGLAMMIVGFGVGVGVGRRAAAGEPVAAGAAART
jgi:BASS family bile acid:Na+ symporter